MNEITKELIRERIKKLRVELESYNNTLITIRKNLKKYTGARDNLVKQINKLEEDLNNE